MKHLHVMSGSVRNGEYFFLGTHNVPPGFAPGNIEGLRETKLIVSLMASH